MNKFKSLVLNNVVYYKSAKIKPKDNITVIFGENGAGKSQLFSTIPNILYGSSPSSVSKNKKDILDNTASSATFTFVSDKPYRVTQTQKNWSIEEYENGRFVDLGYTRIADQQNKISEIFPITETEFYSYIYFQSQYRLEFQTGTPRARLNFISKVFDLDNYDLLHKYFVKKLSEIKKVKIEYDTIKVSLDSIESDKQAIGWTPELKRTLQIKAKEQKEVSDSLSQLHKELADTKSLIAKIKIRTKIISDIKKLDADLVRFAKLPDADSILDDTRIYYSKIGEYYSKKKKLENFIRENSDVKEYPKDKIPEFKSIYIEKSNEYKSAISELEHYLNKLKKTEKEINALQDKVKEKPSKTLPLSTIQDNISDLSADLKLEKLLKINEPHCPTCNSSIDKDLISSKVRLAKKKIKHYRNLLSHAKEREEYIKNKKLLSDLLEDAPPPDRIDKVEKRLNNYRNKLKDLENRYHTFLRNQSISDKLQDYKEQLDDLKKPVLPEKAKQYSIIPENISEFRETSSKYYRLKDRLKASEKVEGSIDDLRKTEAKLKSEILKLSKNKSYEESVRLSSKESKHKLLVKKQNEYKQKLLEIEPELQKEKLYRGLEQAYSAKGLKVERADKILETIQHNMNRLVPIIFSEKFSFDFFSDEKGVHCTANRENGKSSDIRLLSAAESDCFRLLFMLTLNTMVPSTRRTNFVILDEPDSHMHDKTREIFRDSYLPELKSIIPNIYLITPKNPDFYDSVDCDFWKIERKLGETTLTQL